MTDEQDGSGPSVNPHYLDHLASVGASHGVEASEDILALNGMKLLAKGARIDPAVRERLLEYKLRYPLEDCVRVIGAVVPERFGPAAERLLQTHPMLHAICSFGKAQPIPASLSSLRLSVPVSSLLTVYCEHQKDRLDHSVGVAMLALALARKLLPGDVERHRALALSGLLHDVGELYIDPAYLNGETRIGHEAWRHIVTHPLTGHRVLASMVGAGDAVASAVLHHHERLDGFGYPSGVAGDDLPLPSQILGAAEWQMAMLENGGSAALPASVATRFVPGEFSPDLLNVLATAALQCEEPDAADSTTSLEDAVPRVLRIADTLSRFRESREWIEERIAAADGMLKRTLEQGRQRMYQIQKAFSMTGLDARNPNLLLRELAALRDSAVHIEVLTMLRELEWRLRELERAQSLQAALLPAHEAAVVGAVIARVGGASGLPPEPSSASPSNPGSEP